MIRHHRFVPTIPFLALMGIALGACGSGSTTATGGDAATTSKPNTSVTSAPNDSSTSKAIGNGIVNTWKASTVDPKKLPIGDSFVSTTAGGVGKLFSCSAGNSNAPGASADGPWINAAANTWDSTTKLAVQGKVSWPTAKFSETVTAASRVLSSNGLPVNYGSGTFPIATTDPAYQYDRNPGHLVETALTVTLPLHPTIASKPTCVNFGMMGMLKNGVAIFDPLDGKGRDGVARELQDACNGHPAMTLYHYHDVSACLQSAAKGSSTVVGYALDGFPIVVERDASGVLPSNADLDACHGRTSSILVDGKIVTRYHYSATLEFPYVVGCYSGTPTA
jgi:hypothetical protein